MSTLREPYPILDFFEQLQNVPPWRKAMKNVKERAALPDIKHRRGLKEAQDKFDAIRARLDAIYGSAQNCGNFKKMASVVILISQMCVDTFLSSKFMAAGLMSKVTPLLGQDAPTRCVALQALFIIAHHGGLPVAEELATYNGLLIRLINGCSDDAPSVKIAISVLAAIDWFIFSQVDSPSPSLITRMSLQDVMSTAVAILRAPLNSDRTILLHALQLLVAPTEHCSDACKAFPSLTPILATVTRSKCLSARITAVQGLMGLHQSNSVSERTPFRLLEALRSSSFKLQLCRLVLRGESSYTINLVQDLNKYTLLLRKLAQPTCDLYVVGKDLAGLIQRHDSVVSELIDDRNTGQNSVYFPEWLERFVSCARELRTRTVSSSDHDLVDILEMKILILRGRDAEAKALAKRAIVRNPDLTYAYYVVAQGPATEEGLRVAKLGLRCCLAPSFMRSQLLWVALEFATRVGLSLHSPSGDADPRLLSLFSEALKDARTFMAETPRDHPSVRIIFSWIFLLLVLLQRPGYEQELESTRQQLGQIVELTVHLGYDGLDMQLRRTEEFLCQEYDRGLRDWDHLVEGLGGTDSDALHDAPELDIDDLSWIRELQGCVGYVDKLSPDELYRCSWCRKASARPKRCLGCKVMMYCDSSCQRLHWPIHKSSCERADRVGAY